MPALILMYHDLCLDPRSATAEHRPYVLSPSTFERQLESVSKSDLQVMSVAEWCSTPKSSRGLILTFDDGHISNHQLALPILRSFGFKGTFFVTAGRIGTAGTMDWSQIHALHAAGMEIGSHTLTHRLPSTLDDQELRHELVESRRVLEDGLGAPVTSISSPTGFFNARMRDIAREVGYRALCIGQPGLVAEGADPYSLCRIAIKASLHRDKFEALLRFDHGLIQRLRFEQWLRAGARTTLGPTAYLGIRRVLIRGVASLKGKQAHERA
jgi:peptidoglycan/xylan/chitin deacetylase (PgdA/CDA1 family)